MSRMGLAGLAALILSVSMSALAATGKIISCPAVSLKQYGKPTYFDARIGRTWSLQWLTAQTPRWDSVSIPKTTACGAGRANNGISITYQCAIFECKSAAVIASLSANQSLKCFSAYASTKNTFYCNNFSANQ